MNARELLAQATPRPWREGRSSGAVVSDDRGNRRPLDAETVAFYGGVIVGESIEKPDRDLIVRAVNEYEALLDVAEAAHDLGMSWNDDRGGWLFVPADFHLSGKALLDALARLDGIRGQQ